MSSPKVSKDNQSSLLDIESAVRNVLATIEKEREREIISRRFGLFDRKETLEQIGELLNITRERVRQLEKAMLNRLKEAAQKDLAELQPIEAAIEKYLNVTGFAARVSEVAFKLSPKNDKLDQSRIAFLAQLSPRLSFLEDNDNFHASVGLTSRHEESMMKKKIEKIIEVIQKIGHPTSIEEISTKAGEGDTQHTQALAGLSKHIATLNSRWGLIRWPMVNPKNIRDKIYVILHDGGKPMHFGDIAKAIKLSEFKRKDVTTQAIHNELIKDSRFVLIGRGIYALREWGYKAGTVSDVIASILKKEGGPLHRDEIVRRVLKSRQVQETTILLNLQSKPQFKRVAKATYALDTEQSKN